MSSEAERLWKKFFLTRTASKGLGRVAAARSGKHFALAPMIEQHPGAYGGGRRQVIAELGSGGGRNAHVAGALPGRE
jgi:hypothetical protein